MLLFDTGKKLEKAVGEEAARIIVEALEKFGEEQRKDAATKGDLRETELRLQKEIETVRKEIREVELGLQKEIETVRKEMKEVELRLQKNVDATRYGLLRWQLGVGLALAVIMAKGFGWLGF